MTELAQFLQAISIIIACWSVIAGIGAWKREFIGKRKIELAESALAGFFEVRDAIAFIRSPWSNMDEGKSRERAAHESKDAAELLDRAHVAFERYQKKREVFNTFTTMKYRFMAAFGKEAEPIFVGVNTTLNRIFVSARMLGTFYWQRQGRVQMSDDEIKRHLADMNEQEQIFWDHGKEDDVIKKELADLLESLEIITAPCFEEPSTMYSLFTKKISKWRTPRPTDTDAQGGG